MRLEIKINEINKINRTNTKLEIVNTQFCPGKKWKTSSSDLKFIACFDLLFSLFSSYLKKIIQKYICILYNCHFIQV